jgi:hypothetical protein
VVKRQRCGHIFDDKKGSNAGYFCFCHGGGLL